MTEQDLPIIVTDAKKPELRPYQVDAIRRLELAEAAGKKKIVLQAQTGLGKCLGKGTPVLLYDGRVKNVEDINIGDDLMGPDSTKRTVLSLARGREMMYRVVPVKGDPYIVNESHILSLKFTSGYSRASGKTGGEIVNISVKEYLSKNKGFKHCAKGWRVGVNFKEQTDPLLLDPYFLGLWLGDGSKNISSITTGDKEIKDFITEYAASVGMIVRVEPNSENSEVVHMQVNSGKKSWGENPIMTGLRHYSILNNKHIPRRFLCGSREERLEVLAGLVDSDGFHGGGCYEITQKNHRLSKEITFLARSLGLAANMKLSRKQCVNNGKWGFYFRIVISGDIDNVPCLLPRKKARKRRQIKNVLMTGIKVEPVGVGDYYGFEIDGDRLFLLGDFTVTHNTLIACALMEHAVANGMRVLFLAHRRDLIFQCANKIREFGLNCGIVMGSEVMNHSEPIQVASVQSLHGRGIKRNRIAMPEADLVIIDEVHKSLSTTYLDIINHYKDSIILGLTATPCRSDGRGLGHVFEHMEVCMKMDQAVKEGWLVPVRYFAPSIPDLKGIKVTAGDYNQGQLEDRMNQVKLIGDIVENWTRLGDNRQTVIFSSGVKHAMHIAEAFRSAGHNFEYVCGDTPQEERNRVNRGLADGTIRGVANAMVWTEGWDNPRVSCAILARPTKSPGLYIQMAGRILRPYPGKTDAKIIDHSGSIYNLGRLDEYSDWELNADGNLFKQVQEQIKKKGKEITCESCKAVYSGQRRCPECGNEPKSFGKGIEFIDGRLYELGTQPAVPSNPALAPQQIKQKWYSQILCYAETRGYKKGWVSHTYKDKFGVWPKNMSHKPEATGKEVMAHIQKKIMQYRYMQRGQGATGNA